MLFHPMALEGALFQAVFHALAKNALFMATGASFTRPTSLRCPRCGGGQRLRDHHVVLYTGLPVLIGIPPTGGFVSKWLLAEGALSAGEGSLAYWGVGVLMVSALADGGLSAAHRDRSLFPG